MAKLALKANPTFPATVAIPVAGSDPVNVKFTFTHRTKSALDAFIGSRAEVSDIDSFMSMVEGWDLEDAFTKENAESVLENYIGSALVVYRAYIDELVKAKVKN